MLWTGGKDCALACWEASRAGHEVALLVTFAGAGNRFRAHPLPVMQEQAAAMGVRHAVKTVAEPYDRSYRAAICDLRDQDGIDLLVTGDIAPVAGYPNWIRQCAEGTGVAVMTPLWEEDRAQLLARALRAGFRIIFSCVRRPWLPSEWAGRELTAGVSEELRRLSELNGMDICGEQGEYHTLVIDGPIFRRPPAVDPARWARREEGDLTYLAPGLE